MPISESLAERVRAHLTDEPDAFISFQRRIALKNVSESLAHLEAALAKLEG